MSVLLRGSRTVLNTRPPGPDTDQPWRRWQDWANLMVGIWLWTCPGLFDSLGSPTSTDAVVADIIAGTVITGLSVWSLAEPRILEIEGIVAVVATWLIMTPSLFGFIGTDPTSTINNWATGAMALTLAVWSLTNRAFGKLSQK